MKKYVAGIILVLGAIFLAAGIAEAHTASVTCDAVSFSSFPSGQNTATVTVNGTAHPVSWAGSSASFSLKDWYTSTPVTVHVAWTADGGGTKDAVLSCTVPTTTTQPPPTTTQPPPPALPAPPVVLPPVFTG